MKGRANYLCLHRLDQLSDSGLPAMHDVFLPIIREWAGRSETGDRAELEDLPKICRSGTKCRRRLKRASGPSVLATTTASSRGCGSAPPPPTS